MIKLIAVFLTIAAAFMASAQSTSPTMILQKALVLADGSRKPPVEIGKEKLFFALNSGATLASARAEARVKKGERSALKEATTTFQRFSSQNENGYFTLYNAGGGESTLLSAYQQLKGNPEVKWVSFDYVPRLFQAASQPTNDPLAQYQWALGDFPGSIGAQRIKAWGSDHVYAFFNDTGLCLDHLDIDRRRYFWGLNKVNPGTEPIDDHGHGCNTSSEVVAIANNGIGIRGIAPFVWFGGVKMFDKNGRSKMEWILEGLYECAEEARRIRAVKPFARFVMNLSFGFDERVTAVDEAIQAVLDAGIIVVVAAGNTGTNLDLAPASPCSTQGVTCVGAVNALNGIAGRNGWISNFGPKTVRIAASGQGIMAATPTVVPGLTPGPLFTQTGYVEVDGTSVAAPYVTGAICLALAEFPELPKESIDLRFSNGKLGIQPFRLMYRTYEGEELFSGGRTLYLPSFLMEDWSPPAQPTLEVLAVGSSSARVAFRGTEFPLAYRCFVSEGEFDLASAEKLGEMSLIRNQDQTDLEIYVRWSDRRPLKSNTQHTTRCQVADTAGNWSNLSEPVEFKTSIGILKEVTEFHQGHGPLAQEIIDLTGWNNILWHQADFGMGLVWYTGSERLRYGGLSDSVLSFYQDLTQVSGSAWMRLTYFLQMLGTVTEMRWDSARVRVCVVGGSCTVVAELQNSTKFWEELSIDLSEFVGKEVEISIDFFINDSSTGMGLAVKKIEITTD